MTLVQASGIPVHCAHREIVDITSLVPNPRNPNQHGSKQIELLAKIIKTQGWRAPITVSNRSGFVVRGHGRLLAAQLLRVSQLPVDRQDYDTEAEEWADLIADNRIAELSQFDDESLKELLDALNTGDFDTDLTGLDEKAIENLFSIVPEPDINKIDDDEQNFVVVTFRMTTEEFETKKDVIQEVIDKIQITPTIQGV